jgi:hypothetical protein
MNLQKPLQVDRFWRRYCYCDDFVVVSNGTLAEAKAVKEELKDFLGTALHLELSEEQQFPLMTCES